MTKQRLIATLLVRNGHVVQTRRFRPTNMVGHAFTAVEFFNSWSIDEIVILDISPNPDQTDAFVEIIEGLSRRCFVPLSVGGKIRSLDLVRRYTRAGADKVVVNSGAVDRPDLIAEIADAYGSQCCVLSVDARADVTMPSGFRVMVGNGQVETAVDVLDWIARAIDLGAGEVLLNSVDHDGDRRGYDLDLIRAVADRVSVPVIAMGGVGKWDDLVDGIRLGHADAVAAGNIFHYTEHSTKKAKEHLEKAGLNVRPSKFYTLKTPRRPIYRP